MEHLELLPSDVTSAVCLLNKNVMGGLEGKPVACVTERRHSGKRSRDFSNMLPVKTCCNSH